MPMKISSLIGTLALAAFVGCTHTPPPVTEVEGVVLLNEIPLPKAHVEFVPDLQHFGAEMNSIGATDEKGKFQLTCHFKSQPGAVVGKHRVVVTEVPVTAEMRGMDQTSQRKLNSYLASLTNRPIPERYGSAGKTPVIIEVTKEQKSYQIKLTR
jgi:hypothetical protein